MKENTNFFASKCQIDAFLDKSGKTKAKIKNLETYNLIYINRRRYFDDNESQKLFNDSMNF